MQVHPSEHGLLLFRFANTLFHYRVCHFGARFSAYWWQRTGAFLLRLLHGILAAISAPISWKMVQFQDALTWCGWNINFNLETIELTPVKTMKLIQQLRMLLKSGKVKRKLLEQALGLLIWATSLSLGSRHFTQTCKHLRAA